MTAQHTRDQRDMWRQIATDAGDDPYANTLHPEEVLALLDQLDQAEHRIARLEAQTSIRARAAIMYRERARTAEAERDAAHGYISELETAVQSRNDVIKHRDTRIKAVRDVLDRHTQYGLVEADDIRRALEG